MERLYAVRGAITIDTDSRPLVIEGTQRLLRELLDTNDIAADAIVNIFFTATDDIGSEFPAAAARLMGLADVPLLCARELDVTSTLTLPRCIRVLIQFYGRQRPQPVYLGGALKLLDPPPPA